MITLWIKQVHSLNGINQFRGVINTDVHSALRHWNSNFRCTILHFFVCFFLIPQKETKSVPVWFLRKLKLREYK